MAGVDNRDVLSCDSEVDDTFSDELNKDDTVNTMSSNVESVPKSRIIKGTALKRKATTQKGGNRKLSKRVLLVLKRAQPLLMFVIAVILSSLNPSWV